MVVVVVEGVAVEEVEEAAVVDGDVAVVAVVVSQVVEGIVVGVEVGELNLLMMVYD